MLKMLIGKTLVNVTCFYVPQVGLSNHDKDAFYEQLLTCISSIEYSEIHIIAGDFNAHVWKRVIIVIEAKAIYGTRNLEELRILDLYSATDLAVSNTFFDKSQNKLIVLSSADNKSQTDYILIKRSLLKHVRDVKVIHNEKCITQHKF